MSFSLLCIWLCVFFIFKEFARRALGKIENLAKWEGENDVPASLQTQSAFREASIKAGDSFRMFASTSLCPLSQSFFLFLLSPFMCFSGLNWSNFSSPSTSWLPYCSNGWCLRMERDPKLSSSPKAKAP